MDSKEIKHKDWCELKINLDSKSHKPPLVSERDIWWISSGKNIGSEMNGKSDKFSRPAIVYKKLAHGLYMVIPTSTAKKEGTWYISIKQRDVEMVACLHQVRVVDYRRVWSKMGQIDKGEFTRIEDGFKKLYTPKKYSPS